MTLVPEAQQFVEEPMCAWALQYADVLSSTLETGEAVKWGLQCIDQFPFHHELVAQE